MLSRKRHAITYTNPHFKILTGSHSRKGFYWQGFLLILSIYSPLSEVVLLPLLIIFYQCLEMILLLLVDLCFPLHQFVGLNSFFPVYPGRFLLIQR